VDQALAMLVVGVEVQQVQGLVDLLVGRVLKAAVLARDQVQLLRQLLEQQIEVAVAVAVEIQLVRLLAVQVS